MISPSIKLEALKHIFGSVLKKNALFGKMKKRKQSQKSLRAALASDIIDEDPTRDVLNLNTEQMKILTLFVVHLQQGIFYPEDVIFKQGDEGNNMYFICKGECEVFVKDLESKTKTRIIVLTAGDLFGVLRFT
jgi:CRP-like cAMP-binding protein